MRSSWSWSMFVCIAACGSDAAETTDAQVGSESDAHISQPDAHVAQPDAGLEPDAAFRGDAQVDAALCTECGACEESQRITSALHRAAAIDYPDAPPVGGDHAACWTRFGVHTTEVPDERWVHNLEHGAIVFLYHCPAGCPDELARLEALAATRPFALVTPYAALPQAFGVVAWGHRLVSECFDEEAFTRFYEEHVDRAPESTSADGSC